MNSQMSLEESKAKMIYMAVVIILLTSMGLNIVSMVQDYRREASQTKLVKAVYTQTLDYVKKHPEEFCKQK